MPLLINFVIKKWLKIVLLVLSNNIAIAIGFIIMVSLLNIEVIALLLARLS